MKWKTPIKKIHTNMTNRCKVSPGNQCVELTSHIDPKSFFRSPIKSLECLINTIPKWLQISKLSRSRAEYVRKKGRQYTHRISRSILNMFDCRPRFTKSWGASNSILHMIYIFFSNFNTILPQMEYGTDPNMMCSLYLTSTILAIVTHR